MRRYWVIAFLVAAALGISALWLPAPVPADAAAESFSACRAHAHVREIAQKPHPSGSPENQRVRNYISSTLAANGLSPREFAFKQGSTEFVNLYVELPGTQSGRPPVLLISHYDSVPSGPGAGDCASGVATLLETVRAIRASGPLRNAIAVLITDGEERGLIGAQGFVREHPELWRDVPVILNMDARGSRGPVVMFETGANNAELISLFARVCPYPVALSCSEEVYHRMPNDSDFSVFRNVGLHGWNFAFVDGVECYHTSLDTPSNLSLRTLQHEGSSVLALTSAIANADEATLKVLGNSGNATYFPLCRGFLMRYPTWFARALPWSALAIFVVGVWRWRGALRWRKALLSAGVCLMAVLLASGGGVLVAIAVLRHGGKYAARHLTGPLFDWALPSLLVVAVIALVVWAIRKGLKGVTPTEHCSGALVPWLALAFFMARVAPGASYIFVWPALLGAIALAASRHSKPLRTDGPLYATLIAGPAPILVVPVIVLLYQVMALITAPVMLGLTALAFLSFPTMENQPCGQKSQGS